MRFLITGPQRRGDLPYTLATTLESLGHGCIRLDEGTEINKAFPTLRRTWAAKLLHQHATQIADQALYDRVQQYRPDVVWVIKGPHFSADCLHRLRNQADRPILLNFNPDSPFEALNTNRNILSTLPLFDLHLTWSHSVARDLRNHFAKRAEYLAFGWDPDLHPAPSQATTRSEFDADLIFVGSWDPFREEVLERLASRLKNLRLKLYGNSWEKASKGFHRHDIWAGREILGAEMAKAFRNSALVLNLLRRQNQNSHNMRTFEAIGCGSYQIAPDTADHRSWFKNGESARLFSSLSDLPELIKHEVSDLSAIRQKQDVAHKLAHQHTYSMRVQEVIDRLNHPLP